MFCLINIVISVRCSVLSWWVPTFPHRLSLLDVRVSCRLVSSSRYIQLPLKMWRCLANDVQSAVILLWIFLSWFVIGVVSLSHGDVAFKALYLSDFDIYWCVVSVITFVFDLFLFRLGFSLPCCSSCGALAHMSIPSAKRRWLRYLSSSLWISKSVFGICFRLNYRRQPGRYGVWCWSCCFLCVGGLSSSCLCCCLLGVRCTHLLSPVLEPMSSCIVVRWLVC